MRQWTLEERYRVLQSPEEIRPLHERISRSAYRQLYHIQPVTGLSSDPNGFARFKGTWHLFYQWCPWGAVHGLKYWYHVSSPDLIHWKNEGVGLRPDRIYDNKGTHSGSAIAAGEDLFLFYTGNHRDENWVRTPYTCAAVLAEDGRPVKLPEPLFGPRPDYSEHQRDPKILRNPEDGFYYIFLGAQTLDKKGTVLVYRSEKLLEGWSGRGQLRVAGYEELGGMWECPYLVRLGGKDLLIFSPQYTKLPGRGESTNHNIYFIGRMDYEALTFTPEGPFRHLDYGFDFYAAQGARDPEEQDKAVLVAWIGLPDNHYPTAEEDWEGSMSLPRELRIRDGHLFQTPPEAILSLREGEVPPEGRLLPACELCLRCEGQDLDLALFTREDGSGGLRLRYDATAQSLLADRSQMALRFNEQLGEALTVPLLTPLRELRIFIDRSSVEIFLNGGEETFTTHLYPTGEEFFYRCSGETELRIFRLGPSVRDDFVI